MSSEWAHPSLRKRCRRRRRRRREEKRSGTEEVGEMMEGRGKGWRWRN